jgi:hypothetical protein
MAKGCNTTLEHKQLLCPSPPNLLKKQVGHGILRVAPMPKIQVVGDLQSKIA